jgi:hypothetical protein
MFSLALSLPATWTTVFWQDSGFYLTAVREFSGLYPHGVVLYLARCKPWTALAAPLFGFTLAVHLFSALCAAGAASFIARAARAFLKRPIGARSRAIARYHLGEIGWSRGRRDEARTLFEDALRRGAWDDTWKKRIETRLQRP